MDHEALSKLIYEAAVVPERWEAVLDTSALAVNAMGGVLFSARGPHMHGIVSAPIYPAWDDMIAGDWNTKNIRRDRLLELDLDHFVHDAQIVSPDEMSSHEWYTVFCRRWNLGGSLGTKIDVPGGGQIMFTMERHIDAGPYDDADVANFAKMRPDLARAITLTSHLLFQQYKSSTDLLGALGFASAAVDYRGRLLNSNAAFDALVPSMMEDRRTGISLVSPAANAMLREALSRLPPELWMGVAASIPLPAIEGVHAPAIMHVLPIRGLAHDIVHGGAALLVVSPLVQAASPSSTILKSLFDLTPAEARVAQALIDNLGNYRDTAAQLGVAPETVRSQGKAVYQKAGLSGATELISLIGSIKLK